jgi:hypothetical protein
LTKADVLRKRHDDHLDYIVDRLAQKPGVLCVEEKYYDGDHLVGEMDIHRITKNSAGKVFHHYIEIKGKNNSYARKHARRQFKMAKNNYHRGITQTIYTAPGAYERWKK